MTPVEAVFLALALAPWLPRPRRWPWIGAAPLVAFVAALAWERFAGGTSGWVADYGPLVIALAVAMVVSLPALRFAPLALLLAVPDYPEITTALVAAVTWTLGLWLIDGLEERLHSSGPAQLRGAPLRLVVTAALYLALQPLFFV